MAVNSTMATSSLMDGGRAPISSRGPGRLLSLWHSLPREARDTLFLLAVIAWVLAPHLLRLAPWCGALVAAILLWRAQRAIDSKPLPGRWTNVALLALTLALTYWSEGTLIGKEPGVTLLVCLLALKTLELRARRDALVVSFLGFFVVLTTFLYSQSLAIALSSLVSALGLMTGLVLSQMTVGRPSLLSAARIAMRCLSIGVPLMAMLFLLFPRIGPLWGLPQDALGRTGLSGTLRMGGISELVSDPSIAMRVRFEGSAPPQHALYFRGPVLTQFDGREWREAQVPRRTAFPDRSVVAVRGAGLGYELTIEPSRQSLLPLLDVTPDRPDAAPRVEAGSLDPGFSMAADLHWTSRAPITDRLRLRARAWTDFEHRSTPDSPAPMQSLELPAGSNPRTAQWARQWRASLPPSATAEQLARALMDHIRRERYVYTLSPAGIGQAAAIDDFWIDRREGFCEHYASAFVYILRTVGVPARIVTGYQGADAQPVDGWWVVRQSNAHAWAEYWTADRGWVRADPTAAIAPDRVMRGQRLQPPPSLVEQAIDSVHPDLLAGWRQTWELLDNRWNQWVLNYSRARQFGLLESIGFAAPNWATLTSVLITLSTTVALAATGWALWDRQRQDPWQRVQARIARRLATLGVQVGPQDAPRRRAQAVGAALARTQAAAPLQAALIALEQMRYAPGGRALPDSQWWRAFDAAVRQAATVMAPNRN